MGEFFKGWRRRVGVLTLLMACLFLIGWLNILSDEFSGLYDVDITKEKLEQILREIDGKHSKMFGLSYYQRLMGCFWIFITLSAMSAYLLLSEPRKRPPQI